MKIKKNQGRGFGSGGVRVRGSGWGGQGGCKRRIEVLVKFQKKNQGGGGRVGGSGWM